MNHKYRNGTKPKNQFRPAHTRSYIGIIVIGCFLPVNANCEHFSNAKQKLQLIQREINDETDNRRAHTLESSGLEKNIGKLQGKLVQAASETQKREQMILDTETRLRELSAQTYDYTARLNERKSDLSETLLALIRLQKRPPILAIANAEKTVDLQRIRRLLFVTSALLKSDADNLNSQIKDFADYYSRVSLEKERLKALSKDLSRSRLRLTSLVEKMRERRSLLQKKEAQSSKNLENLATQAKDLRDLMIGLKLQANKKKTEQKDLQLSNKRHKYSNFEKRDGRLFPSGTLLTPKIFSRGRLAKPARGHITKDFGQQNKLGLREKGVTLLTRTNAQVVSPFGGIVAFVGPFRDYGLVLIISHGQGYHTLLAGLSRAYVQTSQQVLAGEPVGHMGDSDDQSRSLYVELRRKDEAVDPKPWWIITSVKGRG